MHYPKLQILIDHLKSVESDDFNMLDSVFYVPCCIGGHAKRILNRDEGLSDEYLTCDEALNKLCDLPYDIGSDVAYYYPESLEDNPASKDIAVKMLENLRDTGKVNWDV